MEAGATASGLGLRGGYLLSCSPLAWPGKHPMGDPWLASTSLRHWATSWLTVGLPSAVYALALAALTFSFSVAMVALVYAVWILISRLVDLADEIFQLLTAGNLGVLTV